MKDLIAKILAPQKPIRINKKTYWISQRIPWNVKQKAALIYEDVVDKYRFSGMLRRAQVNDLLLNRGIDVKVLGELNDSLDKLKVQLYEKYPDTFAQSPIRAEIQSIKKETQKIYTSVSSVDFYTLESYAEKLAFFYTIRKTSNCPKSFNFLNNVYMKLLEDCFSIGEIRELARSEYWRSIWITKKGSIFQYLPLTDEQISLASYSRLYENVSKHPEAPPIEVIDDDDMLDGWLLSQKKEKVNKGPSYSNKVNSSQEVFILAKNQDHANQIYAMNTDEQRAVQNVRQKQLKGGGVMQFHHFADQRRKLQYAQR